MRVKVMPHTDAWMRGDRYGRVITENEAGAVVIGERSNTTFVLYRGDYKAITNG